MKQLVWVIGVILFFRTSGVIASNEQHSHDTDDDEIDPCHKGEKQSPVDIRFKRVIYDQSIEGLTFKDYDQGDTNLKMKGDGHTVKVTVSGPLIPSIMYGGLQHTYHLIQFHFHWGPVDQHGSEHTLDGKTFPLEVHLVHTTDEENVSPEEELAVVGILFELSPESNPNVQRIVRKLQNITSPGNYAKLHSYLIDNILPSRRDRYFRYHGSLTTPPCAERVIWTVFYDTVPISIEQLNEFRTVLDHHENPITENYRIVQSHGERLIRSSFEVPVRFLDTSPSVPDVSSTKASATKTVTSSPPYEDPEDERPRIEHTHGEKDECHNVGYQSPINIPFNRISYDSPVEGFTFRGYDNPNTTLKMMDNGHTVKVSILDPEMPSIMFYGLRATYHLVQFHFHWGPDTEHGSEHTLDGRMYPLELHLVHRADNTNVNPRERLAVLGVFFELSQEPNPYIHRIIRKLQNVTNPGDSAHLRAYSLENILPFRRDRYFRYSGSLTTPPCSEQVIWIIFYDTISISATQLAEFRRLLDHEEKPITKNYRMVQPRGDRSIQASFMVPRPYNPPIPVYPRIYQSKKNAANRPLLAISIMFLSALVFLL